MHELERILQVADAAGLHTTFDTDVNLNLTITAPGLSKRAGMVDAFFAVERLLGVQIDGATFGGDGKTDENAYTGLDDTQQILAAQGRDLRTVKVAAMNVDTMSVVLAEIADLVVRGGGVSQTIALDIAGRPEQGRILRSSRYRPGSTRLGRRRDERPPLTGSRTGNRARAGPGHT